MTKFKDMQLNYYSKEELKKIEGSIIGIAGAGGLGSNCAVNLVRSGFKNFYIYDYDNVEISNLNRQFYFIDQIGEPKVFALEKNLKRINPEINLVVKKIKIEKENIKELFKDCNIIVEAFDLASYKKLIAEEFLNTDKLIVMASGLAGIGDSDKIIIKKINDNFFIVGDFDSEVSENKKAYSPRVTIAASKEADIILEWVLKNGK